MITLSRYRDINSNRSVCEMVGLSTDTKPIDTIEGTKITNGSTLFCMNNSQTWMFDEENKHWYQI